MNKRKYPTSIFFMGIVVNLVKLWPYFLVVIFLSVICLIFPIIPIVVPIIFTGILILSAVILQYKYKKVILSQSKNEKTNEIFYKMLADNKRGYKNITDTVDEIIKKHQDNELKNDDELNN